MPDINIRDLGGFHPKQQEAREAAWTHKYTFFGGSAGPGKSHFLRWFALEYLLEAASAGFRHVRFGLFSETFEVLRDRQIAKIELEFPPSLGEVKRTEIEGLAFVLRPQYGEGFIALRNLDDPAKYVSTEFAGIGVDELTMNQRPVFDRLRERLRWPGLPHWPFVGAANPVGIGLPWVKKLWIDRDFSGDEDKGLDPREFAFIQALPTDNPYIPEAYLKELRSLPTRRRKALYDGNWDVFEGQLFDMFDRMVHVHAPFEIPPMWPRWVGIDWGWSAPFCALWFALAPKNAEWPTGESHPYPRVVVYRELYERNLLPWQQAQAILAFSREERVSMFVADPSIWNRTTNQSTGAKMLSVADEYIANGLPVQRGNSDRHEGVSRIMRALMPHAETKVPELVIFDTCSALARTLPALPTSRLDPELWDERAEDHAPDALKYGLLAYDSGFHGAEPPKPQTYAIRPARPLRPRGRGVVAARASDVVRYRDGSISVRGR